MSRQPGHVTFVSRRPRGSYTMCHVNRRGRISHVTSREGAYSFRIMSPEGYLSFMSRRSRGDDIPSVDRGNIYFTSPQPRMTYVPFMSRRPMGTT